MAGFSIGPQAGANQVIGSAALPASPTFRSIYVTPAGLYICLSNGTWTLLEAGGISNVTGTGTNNLLTKWTDGAGSVIGDSLISDNGTTLAYNTNKFTVAAASGNTLIAGTVTISSLTATRVPYAGTAGLLSDDSGFTYNSATHALTTTTFIGVLTGNASTASAVALGGITGLGTSVATALGVNVGSAGALITFNGAGGTPSSLVGTNISGTAASLTAGNATLAANLSRTVNGQSLNGGNVSLALASGDFANQGTTTTVLHGNAAGNPSFGAVALGTDVSGTLAAAQFPALTGDITTSAGALATTLANIPTAVPAAGTIVHTNIAAPSSPAAGKVAVYSDSTDLRFHDKNAAGTIGTTVVANTGAASNFLTAISAAGVVSRAQPTFSDLATGTATAFTLGGTVSGGANQINNVVIGTSTPLAGTFTVLTGTSRLELATSASFPGAVTDRARAFYSSVVGLWLYGKGSTYDIDLTNAGGSDVIAIPTGTTTVVMPGLGTSSAITTGTVCWTTGTGLLNVDTTTTCLLSSAKYKKNSRALDLGLEAVLKLRPVSYFLKKKYDIGIGEQVGLFAEDVAEIDKRLVSLEEDGSPHAVRYQQLSAVLAAAIQEQHARYEALESRFNTLWNTVNA